MPTTIIILRVCLEVTEMKSHPGIKKIMFTREFHPGVNQVEFHPRMKFSLTENLLLNTETYNMMYHFSHLLKRYFCTKIKIHKMAAFNDVENIFLSTLLSILLLIFLLRHFHSWSYEIG